jgi:hypothetical protein
VVDMLVILVAVPAIILGLLLGLDLIECRPRRKTGAGLLAPGRWSERRRTGLLPRRR